MRPQILQLSHDHPTSGHFGIERSLQKFQHHFFWPDALQDVTNWIRSCHKCNQYNTPPQGSIKAPLTPINTDHRFQIVHYDLAGPFLPKTARGHSYALIIVDHFSQWPEFVPLSRTDAPTLALTIFDHWCCRYGMPERLHSDGAHNVHGHVMMEFSKLIGIDKSKSSRLHPQGDGKAEAYVKILKHCIQKQVDKFGSDWDLYLQSAAFAVRSNVATSTKCSPAELVLGSKLRAPLNSLYPEPTYHGVPYNQRQAQQFAHELISNIKRSTDTARQVLERSRLQMKQQYDKTAGRYHKLSVGDSVMLWDPYYNPKVSRCFQRKWNGPYTIDRFTSDSNCKIVDCSNKYKFVHVNQLKRTEPRKCNLTVKPSEAIGEQQRVQYYTVENVIPVDNHIHFDSKSESESENEI